MTNTQPRPGLPPAPADPHDSIDFRVLTDGDVCDTKGCPAVAYVRVHIHKRTELDGTLHWCAHHWRQHADTIRQMALNGEASIIDETSRLS